MKKKNLSNLGRAAGPLLLACLLTGCAALLERSYSVVEPYAARYWDSGAEDTLRVDNYQDLVNSLLLLIEQKAEEGVIRCYGEAGEYRKVMAAREEVRRETMLGAYLLQDLRVSHESGASYSTVTCQILYREDAEEISSIMALSDSQSLVDLLRLAVREDLDKQTARFTYDISREEVAAAVESLWQELCRQELEERQAEEEPPEEGPEPPEEGEPPEPAPEEPQETEPAPEPAPEGGAEPGGEPEPVEYPPCPWQIRFYPNHAAAEIVEVVLRG